MQRPPGTAASPLEPSLQRGAMALPWKGFCRRAMAGLDMSFPKAEGAKHLPAASCHQDHSIPCAGLCKAACRCFAACAGDVGLHHSSLGSKQEPAPKPRHGGYRAELLLLGDLGFLPPSQQLPGAGRVSLELTGTVTATSLPS